MKLSTIFVIIIVVLIIIVVMLFAGYINKDKVASDAKKAGGFCFKWDENNTKCLSDLFSRDDADGRG